MLNNAIWLAELRGHENDLTELAAHSVEGRWEIGKPEDKWWLTDAELNQTTDAHAALGTARDRIALLNGCALLFGTGYEPVTVSRILRRSPDGKHEQFISPEGIASTVRFSIPSDTDESGATKLQRIEVLADEDAELERALSLFGGLPITWRNLYIILEIIEDAFGGEKKLCAQPWAPPRLKEFKAVANNYRAIGVEARHGSTGPKFQKLSSTMQIDQARELVRKALDAWIKSKGLSR